MMLEYSQIFTDHRRSQFLNEALKELKESLEAHKSIESLQSREQYYEFIGALYKASCGFELQNRQEKTAQDLKNVSILLYDHYCRHQTAVVHDAFSQRLITSALLTLGLPVFIKDTLPVDSIQSIPILPKEQSSLTTETNFKRSSIKR